MKRKLLMHLSSSTHETLLKQRLTTLGYDVVRHHGRARFDAVGILDEEKLECSPSLDYPILFTDEFSESCLRRVKQYQCSGIIFPDTTDTLLRWIIDSAFLRQVEHQALLKERDALRKKLRDRPVVEKAKLLLMRRLRLSEEEAYQFMRSEAMRLQMSLGELASSVLLHEE